MILNFCLSWVGIMVILRYRMRVAVTWLMVFCVVAGLGARIFAADTSRSAVCAESTSCCDHSQSAKAPAEHQHQGEDCPLEHHHHHGCCSHPLPLTLDTALIYRLGIPSGSLLAIRHEGEITPEGPFLGSEKPPLI
jgi:hypothetical protein